MQTFLPYSDFKLSASVLDRLRLGKQRVEAYQILRTLTGRSTGWSAHPAVKMWKGYEHSLLLYCEACIWEWTNIRGYKNTIDLSGFSGLAPLCHPPWLGDSRLYMSHRSNLIRKAPEIYGDMWPTVPNNLPYYWPVK